MSDAVNFSWLEVFTEVIGTVILSDCAVASALARLALRLRHRDFIIFRIDLDQHSAFLHVLVVIHVDLDHIAGNARADGVEVNIHLGVVGRFITAEIAPQEDGRRQATSTTIGDQNAILRLFERAYSARCRGVGSACGGPISASLLAGAAPDGFCSAMVIFL